MAVTRDGLGGAQPGERWVVRHRLDDGSATDLTGWFRAVAAGRVELVDASGGPLTVRTDAIIAARRVPEARGGPDPRRVSAADLQRRILPSWLAWHEPLGEWTLRAGGGFTGRANSCHAVGDPGRPVAAAAEQIIGYAATHHIAPMAQVITGGVPDTDLRGLGWTDTYQPTDVLVVRLNTLLGRGSAGLEVGVSERLADGWWAAYQQSRLHRADPRTVRMIVDGSGPLAFAGVQDAHAEVEQGATMAIGRGHLSQDWLGLAAIWVHPDHRRRGLATAVMVALGRWAARQGARYGYLQVAAANPAAQQAYERLGFVHHHAYGYLRPG